MCGCLGQRNFENGDDFVMRRRCICWCEPVRRRPERRREQDRCNLQGMCLTLKAVDDVCLPAGCPVVFNQILTDNSCFMSYDHEEGIIGIHKRGIYMIDWDIAIEKSAPESFACFGIEVNENVKFSSTLPTKGGQLSGKALVHVHQIPTTVRLVNDSCETVKLSNNTPVANLRIVTVE